MSSSNIGTFRGVEVNRLARLVERACAGGGIVMMKSCNITQNLGKEPYLVMAEMLIMSLIEEETPDE